VSGEKTKLFEAAPADVSTRGANSWVFHFALDSRLPATDSKKRPVGERCTAVLQTTGRVNRSEAEFVVRLITAAVPVPATRWH